jgi:hypothetical protein
MYVLGGSTRTPLDLAGPRARCRLGGDVAARRGLSGEHLDHHRDRPAGGRPVALVAALEQAAGDRGARDRELDRLERQREFALPEAAAGVERAEHHSEPLSCAETAGDRRRRRLREGVVLDATLGADWTDGEERTHEREERR